MRISVCLLVFLLACSNDTEPTAPPDAEVEYTGPVNKLPAYPLPGERYGAAKGDAFDDYRFANPELYAITEAPKLSSWRHMREWEPMQSMLLTATGWPASDPNMKQMYTEIVAGAASVAKVWIIYEAAAVKSSLTTAFSSAGIDMGQIEWFKMPNESIWHIDYGPLPIIDTAKNTVGFVDFVYYHARPEDDAISTRLGEKLGVTTYRYENSYEGGNFQGDGQEHCYTTQRGLQYSGLTMSKFLKGHEDYMNCTNTHILKDITNDGTGHIDMFFKLYDKKGVVLGYYKDEIGDAVNQKRMDDNEDLLKAITFAGGGQMKVHRIPMPGFGYEKVNGGELKQVNTPFTFVNSTLINKVNLWPIFSFPQFKEYETEALGIWKEALPDYEHVGIISDDVSLASGAIHCITRTIPDLPLEKTIPDGTCSGGKCKPPAGFTALGMTEECSDNNICFGPAWLCTCNDCDSACKAPEETPDGCGDVTYEGCCDGDELSYCEGNKITKINCGAGTCGWDTANAFYNCNTDGKASPYPEFPLSCDGGEVCLPDCAGKDCGIDGCGGTCGKCDGGAECSDAGICEVPPCDDQCVLGEKGCNEGWQSWVCATNGVTGCTVIVVAGCAAGQTCVEGDCVSPGDPCDDLDCDDDDPCSADGCVAGECTYAPIAGCCTADADCNDTEICVENACLEELIDPCLELDCDDKNPCTEDSCGELGCENAWQEGCCLSAADCADGEDCTNNECLPEGEETTDTGDETTDTGDETTDTGDETTDTGDDTTDTTGGDTTDTTGGDTTGDDTGGDTGDIADTTSTTGDGASAGSGAAKKPRAAASSCQSTPGAPGSGLAFMLMLLPLAVIRARTTLRTRSA